MELRQLRYLEAVLEVGTFTAAAAKCRVAQPALWAQVRALETEWDLVLFERVGRRVRPTETALALRPLIRMLLGDAVGIEAEVLRLRTGESGVVTIGTSSYQLNYFLAEALARYSRAFPSAPSPTLVPVATADPYTALLEGKVDLVSGTEPNRHGLESLPLYPVWLIAIGKSVKSGDMEITSLRDHELALLPQTIASRALLEAEFARAGLTPRVRYESEHAEGLVALAREGLATAVLVNEALPADVRLPIARLVTRGKAFKFDLSLMWRREATLSPAARRLRDTICDLASERRRATGGAPTARAASGLRRSHARRDR